MRNNGRQPLNAVKSLGDNADLAARGIHVITSGLLSRDVLLQVSPRDFSLHPPPIFRSRARPFVSSSSFFSFSSSPFSPFSSSTAFFRYAMRLSSVYARNASHFLSSGFPRGFSPRISEHHD